MRSSCREKATRVVVFSTQESVTRSVRGTPCGTPCTYIRRIRKSSWNDRLVNASIVSQRNASRRKRTVYYAAFMLHTNVQTCYYDLPCITIMQRTIVFQSKVVLPDSLKFRQKRIYTNTPAWSTDIYLNIMETTTRTLHSYYDPCFLLLFFSSFLSFFVFLFFFVFGFLKELIMFND